ncbi:S49 family peptidase [Neptunomonas antarctica]|uniref:Protease-4 n=1 Tax=Neptunomonas antarctica TaxID=619304 RepID=A0A1N7PK00_9GAMM|nr:S49 family peptidase [Neptunomonas antarctica]SIT10810.1 protease-4 [Neptunomonas antarctica]
MSENHWDEEKETALDQELAKAAKKGPNKEWKLIEKMLNGLFVEQRRARRWGIFFKGLTFAYLIAVLGIYFSSTSLTSDLSGKAGNHTAVVEIVGPISADEVANADSIIWSLREAFEEDKAKAVILRINSPGGSPVQSGYVYDEIKRLRGLYPAKPVYAVIVDIGASGAYYIAAAADEIYADKASLVGSIGVISGGFGFVGLMDKVGVERRAMTAGKNKGFLDPYSPMKDSDKVFWQSVLDTTHKQFIDQVRKGRGDKLIEEADMFSGLVWTGEQALEKGLIDGLGSTSFVARDIVGEEKLVDYSSQMSPLDKVIEKFGVTFAKTIATQLGMSGSYSLR